MKRFFLIILFFNLIFSNTKVYWLEWYNLYKQRINEICWKYKPEKSVYSIEKKYLYKDYTKNDIKKIKWKTWEEITIKSGNPIWNKNDLEDAKYKYKQIMNNIYKCWIISVQLKSLNLIKKDLNKYDTTIKNKIEKKINRVNTTKKKLKCSNINNQKDPLQKFDKILKQTTYELCKYNSYLEYTKERNKSIINNLPPDNIIYSNSKVWELMATKENNIQEEINKAYKIFPLAFQAYTEYENNYIIHILLELLKDDLRTYKERLHSVINPINQVVYKISNAMNK